MSAQHVLLIEDNPVQCKGIQRMLQGPGVVCTVATTLAEGVSKAVEVRPDIILLDLGLSDSDGLETFHTLRTEVTDVPVVILSALDDGEVAESAVAAGAQDYVMKGNINARALQRLVRYAIERHGFEVERRVVEQRVAQSRQLESIGQLAAGIAHEVNTPTQYVSDNTRFLQDAFLDITGILEHLRARVSGAEPLMPSEIKDLLEEADADYLVEEIPRALDQSLDGLGRITRIVRAMKEFSHPPVDEKVPADLNKALETTVIVASNEWKYVAEVTTELDPDLPAVSCLPGELNQVFLNLIVNAAHAIADVLPPGNGTKGRISVGTSLQPDGNVEIRIADTGCGIASENRHKVFDPFFTTKAVGKGTGQGLAIAHNIVVKKHGGTIHFDSTPGQGTCFFIRLPAGKGSSTGVAGSEPSPP